VTNVTFKALTGLSAAEPSVTRMTKGWKDCPIGTTCELPEKVSIFHMEAGVANNVKVWHGLLPGATHALTWTFEIKFVICAVTLARPEESVVAVPDDREAAPLA
jgi:hypothetical protein